ncbi:hypothetical protein HY468_02040, partial [Candidatus Roizmanbacteria bacterium]|nr:hypothetical protein [Candidatus Roizmanbacteria bacterium]
NAFYAEPRVEQLIEATKNDWRSFSDVEATGRELAQIRYKELLMLRSAAESFHTMNSLIVQGKLDDFVRGAELIEFRQFGAMQSVRGVGEVLRLYEHKFAEMLAKHKWIYTEDIDTIRHEVEETFKKMNEEGLTKSVYADQRDVTNPNGLAARKMNKWEMEQALHAARTYFNITFRASEKVGMGQVPADKVEIKDSHGHVLKDKKGQPVVRPAIGDAKKRYGSFPLENASRMMNWVQLMLWRFDIAPTRGGMQFLQMVKENYEEFMREKKTKLGHNRITELGGMNVEEMEMAGMLGVSGVFSGWRVENLAFPALRVQVSGVDTTVAEWEATNREDITNIRDGGGPYKGMSVNQRSQLLVNKLRPLVENLEMGLGMFVKQGHFGGEVGYEARKMLWERIAEANVPMMANYLQDLKMTGGGVATLETILGTHGITPAAWQDLKMKIQLHHEYNLKVAMGETVSAPSAYLPVEQAVVNDIIANGKRIAPDLADIAFGQLPFLNDLPFEALDAAGAGDEFFRRRIGGDIPQFYKAEGGLIGLMDNPGGIGLEKGLEQLKAIEAGISGPNGTADGQNRVFPIGEAWMNFLMTKPGERNVLINGIKEMFHMPTSIAQEWAGMEADSLDEAKARHVVEEMVKTGILSHKLGTEIKKKRHLTWGWLFWSIFRDIIMFTPVIVGKDVVEEIFEGTALGDKH